MIHCPDCHQFSNPGDRHLWTCKGKTNEDCDLCPSEKEKEFAEMIGNIIKEKGSIPEVEGVFGDANRNKGYVESYLMTEKGMATKFYGCSFLAKGTFDSRVIDSCASVKRAMMATIRFLAHSPWVLPFFLPVWKRAIWWLVDIYEADLEKKTFQKVEEFAPVPREIIRAGEAVANTIPLKGFPCCVGGIDQHNKPCHLEFRFVVARLFKCLATFVQFDSAYYWRIGDVLQNINQFGLKVSPRKEIKRLLDLQLSREHQIMIKLKYTHRLVLFALLFPPIKRFVVRFLEAINSEACVPDESDIYFAYRREGYDLNGIARDKRLLISQAIDLDRGHYIVET